eukprot:CAMPEP_0185752188 /NCGR_PEP_ID=MMETSP1174-20130828/10996_1 /TAXON_ID=35687 /ORGANISM="Dictyocha speculum, Strain CCMP1381" /LENGTH=62 /DNA_ID=CAMNT_0028429531 /DNA_START=154 /DNA_END=339 /DNA_ORIENTATION=-
MGADVPSVCFKLLLKILKDVKLSSLLNAGKEITRGDTAALSRGDKWNIRSAASAQSACMWAA